MNPLAALARRFPRIFGLEWVETEEMFPTETETVYDLRPVRVLSGGWVPVGWEYKP